MEVLTPISDESRQRTYQERAPHVDVAAELLNQWEDVHFPTMKAFAKGFDDAELIVLKALDRVVKEVCDTTPQQLPPLHAFIASPEWKRLSVAANAALRGIRGAVE